LLVEPGKARLLMSSQSLPSGPSLGSEPAITPRCGPKKVLCVLPVTMSAPSAIGIWNAP